MSFRRWLARFALSMSAVLLAGQLGRARAEGVAFGPYDLRSMFHVEKSENQNQVHYALRLDAACRPAAKEPVFAYWRRLKGGVRVDEPLVGLGRRVYGVSDEQDVTAGTTGGKVRMYVKALKRVTIDIQVERTLSGCKATPLVSIGGERARLSYAFLQLRGFGFGVAHVDVFGQRQRDGRRVTQRFE